MLYRDYAKDKYQNAFQISNAEGVPCVLKGSKGKKIRNYELYGNSVQDGTPSPESPVEIQSVGDLVTDKKSEYYGKYDIPVTIYGKNLLYSLPYYTNKIDDNFKVVFVAGRTYTFSFESSTSSKWRLMIWGTELDGSDLTSGINKYLQGMYVNADAPNRLQDASDRTSNSYSYLCNKSFIATSIGVWNTTNGKEDTFVNSQFELGDNSTKYEPYKGRETTHIYLDEPLRKIGDYADYIDFKNQKVVRQIKQLILDGTETWYKGTEMTNTLTFYIKPNNILRLSNQYSILCNKFVVKSSGVSSIDEEFLQHSGLSVYIKINKSRLDGETIDNFKIWVSNNNLEIYYVLSTPTEESIALPALKTFKDTNLISTDSTISSSDIKAKYIKK